MTNSNRIPNRLVNEKSPYLLQHAHNPVDWYPWGEEAFAKAKAENKPIFLSIGYSTCHWCHVMERESFENQEVADILNEHFVSIKVDREERPDIDHIYMTVCQMLTGHGGWPLTILMTPEQNPFYAGTYFPKYGRMGMPGLMDLLMSTIDAWEHRKQDLINSGEKLVKEILPNFMGEGEAQEADVSKEDIHNGYRSLFGSFDYEYGGFSIAPKFPTPHNLSFLLRYWKLTGEKEALTMVEKTLEAMYGGGIFDHVGFGFSRYSTDQKWLVPHFEKMLYDNALLSIAYLEAYQETKKEWYADTARKIFTYILRDMLSPYGGFYSAEDADSEGVEGKFYVWTPQELIDILGEEDGKLFCEYYGITPRGNFEGKNIPNRIHARDHMLESESGMDTLREKVFTAREKRIHPHKDDKQLTSWNGLMIAALSIGGRILDEPIYTRAAERAVAFISEKLIREDGRLLARYREGEAAYPAYVDDYACFVWGLIELYQTTFKSHYLYQGIKMNEEMIRIFWDDRNGGFFLYGEDGERLIARPKDFYDGAIPSGNSIAAVNIIRLARITGDQRLEDFAHKQIKACANMLKENPAAYTHFMMAVMLWVYPTREIVIAGRLESGDTKEMIKLIHSSFLPSSVSVFYGEKEDSERLEDVIPFLENRRSIEGKTTAYVCENFSCQAPITDVGELAKLLQ